MSVSKAFTAIALFSHLQEPMTAIPEQVLGLLRGMHSLAGLTMILCDWSETKPSVRLNAKS